MDKKTQKRPIRASSYQGSYLEVPFTDNDDLYSGRIYRLNEGISNKKQQIARENGTKGILSTIQKKDRAVSCSPSSSNIVKNNRDKSTLIKAMSPDPVIKLNVIDDVIMAPTTSKFIEIRNKKRKLQTINGNEDFLIKKVISDSDICSVDTSSPVSTSTSSFKKEKCKSKLDEMFNPDKPILPIAKDWHKHLQTMYGSVENAEERPWMSCEEKDISSKLHPDTKILEKFTINNWDSEVEDLKKDDPLFRFPSEEGLSREICYQLQHVRDAINLYRTLALPNSTRDITCKRPLFLPFLRRNLRYNKYIPDTSNLSIQNAKILEKKSESLKNSIIHHQNNSDLLDTSDNNTESECSDQDMGIRLISIKHQLLPAGHNASVTFFYTRYSYKRKTFNPINKIDSSTFVVEVKDNISPVNIDLPPELDYDDDDPSDLFIVLRVVFFDAAKDSKSNGRSLRNVPARLAGQCERAREAENKAGKATRKMRETKEGDQAMFGAFQLTKKTTDGWSYACGATSLILVETEKLEIDPNTSIWQKDGSIVFRMIALGRKYHSNPFAYMEVITCDDDDSVISIDSRKSKKYKKRKSIESFETSSCHPEDFTSVAEEDGEPFNYSFPPLILYQLSLDFIHKDNAENTIPVKSGFNAIVCNDEEFIPKNVKRLHVERKALSDESKRLTTMQKEVINIIEQEEPSPTLFTYKVTRSPGWCIFCEIKCKNLFALMWHLKTCHSRFEYVYKSVIEYKPGHYMPGIIMKKSPIDDDMYWNRRKLGICSLYKKEWPQKYTLDGQFITPCNYLFKKVVDTFQDVFPATSLREEFNQLGPRPIDYKHTVNGRLVKKLPEWMSEKMERDLKDIVDLDNLELVFMLVWNKFLFEYGPVAGNETNVYKLCRLFIEKRRKEIQENHLEIATSILISYFVEQKVISSDELYDLIMRLNVNYNPFTDKLHPLSVNERSRAQLYLKREAVKAEKLKRKRPKKVYEKSSISLRRRELPSTDSSRSTSKEPATIDDDDDETSNMDDLDMSSQDCHEKSVSSTLTEVEDTAND